MGGSKVNMAGYGQLFFLILVTSVSLLLRVRRLPYSHIMTHWIQCGTQGIVLQ